MPLVTGTVAGGQVAAGSGTTVNVTAVFLYVDAFAVGGSAVTGLAIAAAGSLPRYDSVVSDQTTGTISVLTGTPGLGNAPVQDGKEPLASILVPAGAASSASYTITDARRLITIPNPAVDPAYTFTAGALSTADPGLGKFGFDATTNSAVTKLIISSLTPSEPLDGERWITIPLGIVTPIYIYFYSATDPDWFWIGKITGVASAGSAGVWQAYPITFVGQGGHQVGAPGGLAPDISQTAYDVRARLVWYPTTSPTSTNGQAALGGDVTLTSANTFFDAVNTGSLAAGTYLFAANIHLLAAAGAHTATARIWDGTTTYCEGEVPLSSAVAVQISLCTVKTLGSTTTVKLSAASDTGTTDAIKAAATKNSAGNLATILTWTRLA